MTEIGVALCVITIIFCLYAIIISRKHKLLTFFLVPLFVFTSFYMYYITNLYKGMPLYDIPTGEDVTLISLKVGKPWIYLVIGLMAKRWQNYMLLLIQKKTKNRCNT